MDFDKNDIVRIIADSPEDKEGLLRAGYDAGVVTGTRGDHIYVRVERVNRTFKFSQDQIEKIDIPRLVGGKP